MAVETRIDADADWFVGEDRVLRFVFTDGDTDGIESWPMVFELFARRAKPGDVPLLSVPVVGIAAVGLEPAFATCQVSGDATALLGAGVFQFVLRRTDEGNRAVLSYGPAELREVTA